MPWLAGTKASRLREEPSSRQELDLAEKDENQTYAERKAEKKAVEEAAMTKKVAVRNAEEEGRGTSASGSWRQKAERAQNRAGMPCRGEGEPR